MKKIILILSLIIISISNYAQIKKDCPLQAYLFNYATLENGKFRWHNREKSDIVIYCIKPNVFRINTQKFQNYTIIKEYALFIDSDGEQQKCYDCIDQDNEYCQIVLISRNFGENEFYIRYSNLTLCYTIKQIPK